MQTRHCANPHNGSSGEDCYKGLVCLHHTCVDRHTETTHTRCIRTRQIHYDPFACPKLARDPGTPVIAPNGSLFSMGRTGYPGRLFSPRPSFRLATAKERTAKAVMALDPPPLITQTKPSGRVFGQLGRDPRRSISVATGFACMRPAHRLPSGAALL